MAEMKRNNLSSQQLALQLAGDIAEGNSGRTKPAFSWC